MSTAERVVIVAVIAVVFVVFAAWFLGRFRKGGLGPPIQMPALTKKGRQRTNASYEKHGWAKPYDDDGNLLPSNQRTLPGSHHAP